MSNWASTFLKAYLGMLAITSMLLVCWIMWEIAT